jgi:hypothetical protein
MKRRRSFGYLLDDGAVREHDRLGAAIAAGCEQFENAAAGGGRDSFARVAAWVAYRGHCKCLRDGDVRVEPLATGRLGTGRRARRLRASRPRANGRRCRNLPPETAVTPLRPWAAVRYFDLPVTEGDHSRGGQYTLYESPPYCRAHLPVLSRRASQPRPTHSRPARFGCTRSSTTASASSLARMASGSGSTAAPAMISAVASR